VQPVEDAWQDGDACGPRCRRRAERIRPGAAWSGSLTTEGPYVLGRCVRELLCPVRTGHRRPRRFSWTLATSWARALSWMSTAPPLSTSRGGSCDADRRSAWTENTSDHVDHSRGHDWMTTRSRTAGPRLHHRERLLWPCDVSLLDAGIVGRSRLHGPRQVTDAHLLALAAGPCAPGARRCSPRASRSTVGPRSPVRPARPFSRRQSANCRQQHRGSVQVWNALVTSSGSHGVSVGTRSPVQSSSVTSRLVSC